MKKLFPYLFCLLFIPIIAFATSDSALFLRKDGMWAVPAGGGGGGAGSGVGGRLTLVTHTPVMASPGGNANSQTYVSSTIYLDCYHGNSTPRYDGSTDVSDAIPSCETSDTMPTSGTGVTNSAGVFDLYWTVSGLCHVTNGSGGGWASDTATATKTGNTHTTTTVDGLTNVVAAGWWPGMTISESHGDIPANTTIYSIGADGTSVILSAAATASHTGGTITVTGATNQLRGFGYSQLHNTRGYWTNVNSITHCYNGSTDYGPISADQGTYRGSIYTTGAGQTTINFQNSASGGTVGIIGLWNAYNQVIGQVAGGDTATSWNVSSTDYAYLNTSSNHKLEWVDGLQESYVLAGIACAAINSGGSSIRFAEGVDWDGTNEVVGNSVGGDFTGRQIYFVSDNHTPRLGFHSVSLLQLNAGTMGTATMYGDNGFCGGGISLLM